MGWVKIGEIIWTEGVGCAVAVGVGEIDVAEGVARGLIVNAIRP